MDILSMMISYDVFILLSILLDLIRQDKYFWVGIRNVVCTVFVVLLNHRTIAPVVPNSNIVLPSNWKYRVMYFMKKLLLLPRVPVRTCRSFGVAIMESKMPSCSWVSAWGVITCKFSTLGASKGCFIGRYYLKSIKFKALYY